MPKAKTQKKQAKLLRAQSFAKVSHDVRKKTATAAARGPRVASAFEAQLMALKERNVRKSNNNSARTKSAPAGLTLQPSILHSAVREGTTDTANQSAIDQLLIGETDEPDACLPCTQPQYQSNTTSNSNAFAALEVDSDDEHGHINPKFILQLKPSLIGHLRSDSTKSLPKANTAEEDPDI
jgi:hypothetical protein